MRILFNVEKSIENMTADIHVDYHFGDDEDDVIMNVYNSLENSSNHISN